MKRRILSIITTLALCLSLLPAMSITASAADGNKAIMWGASGIGDPASGSYDYVYFGNYQQSKYTPAEAPASPAEGTVYTDADGTQFVYIKSRYFYAQGISIADAPIKKPASPDENTVYTDTDGLRYIYDDDDKKYLRIGGEPDKEYTPTTAPASPDENTIYTDTDTYETRFIYRSGGYYKIEPVKWRALDADNSDNGITDPTNTTTNAAMFLLAEQNLDVQKYHTTFKQITWKTSTLRSWLNGYNASENIGGDGSGVDYSSDNFLDDAFASGEQAAIATTNVVNEDSPNGTDGGENTADKVFLLSLSETANTAYGFKADYTKTDNARKATNTAYVCSGGGIGTGNMRAADNDDDWWLRTPGYANSYAICISREGRVQTNSSGVASSVVSYYRYAVRPALNLELDAILFTSAADNSGQISFGATLPVYSGSEWKVTLKDDNDFSIDASVSGTTSFIHGYTDARVTITHAALNTFDAGYTNVTATLTDASGNLLYYGSVNDAVSATSSTITIPTGLAAGDYTLSVYGEDRNGAKMTDYATGTPFTTTITVADVWIGGEQVTAENLSGDGWSCDLNTSTLTLNDASITGVYAGYWANSMPAAAGIYCDGDLNIVLEGNANTIKAGGGSIELSNGSIFYGIYVGGNLTITGNGSLAVSTGENTGSDIAAIRATDFVIGNDSSTPSVTATGGATTGNNSPYSHGIEANTMTVNSGMVTVTGGTATGTSEGIYLSSGDPLLLYNGHVIVTGGTKAVGTARMGPSVSGHYRTAADGSFTSVQSATSIPNINTYFEFVSDSHLGYTDKQFATHDYGCANTCGLTKATLWDNENHSYDAATHLCACGKAKPETAFSGGVTADKPDYTYGDVITITVNPVPSGDSVTFVGGLSEKLSLWAGGVQLTNAADVTENTGTGYSITYDTSNKGIQIGACALTVKFAGDAYMKDCQGNVDVALNAKELTANAAATDRPYEPGNTTVEVTADLSGIVGSDSVSLNAATGTMADANAGANKAVTLPDFTLTGYDTAWYTVTQPTEEVKVNITKAEAGSAMTSVSGYLVKGATNTVVLPALPDGASYGALSFSEPISAASLSGDVLTVIGSDAVDVNTPGSYTVEIPVTNATNYQNYTLTVTLTGTDKDIPVLTAAPFTKTYNGEAVTISDLTTNLTATFNGAAVTGEWTWSAAPIRVSDSGSYLLTFTPTGDHANVYTGATATVTITITQAVPAGTPTCTPITATGSILAEAILSVGTITPEGTIAWDDPDGTVVEANKAYGWTFTPNDAVNYTTLTGTLTPYVVSSGGSSYTPPTQNVTVPISGDDNTIHVDAKVSGDKATVDHVDLGKLDTVIGDHVDTGTVTIDFSGLKTSKPITTVEIPSNVVREIAAAVSDPDNDAHSFEVILSDGLSIEFDAAALSEKEAQADGLDITISIKSHKDAELTAAQKTAVGGRPAFDISVTSGGKQISDMGGKITIHAPYELRDGETARGIVAWYVDAQGHRERCETSYDSEKLRVSWKTDHLSLYMIDYDEALANNPFTDISEDAYYFDAVLWALDEGITSGTTAATFSPNNPCTRAQMATFLWRAAGSPEPVGKSNPFTDVSADAYYAKAVQWAVEQGITNGTSATTFSPNASCTRAQMAVFLYRGEQAKGGGFTDAWMFRVPFTDAPEWAFEAIAWCYMNGVTGGTSATTFSPDAPCTRAQMVTFLYRYFAD